MLSTLPLSNEVDVFGLVGVYVLGVEMERHNLVVRFGMDGYADMSALLLF